MDLAVEHKLSKNIPMILHYCWFGGNCMPKVSKRCIKSWHKYFPDYKWMKWDESNFDVYQNEYVSQAYQAKKYAYVSDYARLIALYEHGGVYLDVDCLVKKSFTPLLNQIAFTGFGGDNCEIAACTMAFSPKHPFLKKCLDNYSFEKFIYEDGTYNMTSINIRMSKWLNEDGFVGDGKEQIVNDIRIYPMTYFCPLSMLPNSVADCKSKKTHSMTIWTDKSLLRERSFLVRLARKLRLNKFKTRKL